MISSEEILEKYWGYSSFKLPQKEVIEAVLSKKDVITLLPTGSGKSICYQIPALLLEGVCLVISPLIALMQDQVNSLVKRGIKATYIKPNSSVDEIVSLFDAIKFNNYKLLYISPERLQSSLIQEKLKELTLSLIAVDEAHCISEWGHDFRPSYRNITQIKEHFQNVNYIALTATATKKVINDIEINLDLKESKLFTKSYFKNNLAYQIFSVEDKLTRLTQIFLKTRRPAIVYVNSRKKTIEVSNFLNANGFKSSFYHGKLTTDQKKNAFDNWLKEETPIMIATNAFGMGIDKSNVGVVIHFDIPSSIENYVQEAGRAGRDSKKSFAVLLKNNHDLEIYKKRFFKNIPTLSEIKKVHRKLYQNFEISNGELLDKSFPLNTYDFAKKYQFTQNKVEFILRILMNNGIVSLSNTFQKKSTIMFKTSNDFVIKYAINNIYIKNFINSILRSYTGLYKQKVNINEFVLAKKNNITSSQVIQYLKQLDKENILEYNPVITDTEIQFLLPREDDRTINLFSKEITQFLKLKEEKFNAFLAYLNNSNICRSIQILNYFDENSDKKCGICDVCLTQKKTSIKDIEIEILKLLNLKKSLTSSEIITHLNSNEHEVLIHLRSLLTLDKIKINSRNKYEIKS